MENNVILDRNWSLDKAAPCHAHFPAVEAPLLPDIVDLEELRQAVERIMCRDVEATNVVVSILGVSAAQSFFSTAFLDANMAHMHQVMHNIG